MYYIIGYILSGAITIVHSNQEVIAANDREGVWRCATTHKFRRLLCRKITSRYSTLDVGVPKYFLRQSMVGVLTTNGYESFPIRSDVTVMVELFWWPRKAINLIYVRKTYYAARAFISRKQFQSIRTYVVVLNRYYDHQGYLDEYECLKKQYYECLHSRHSNVC